MRPCEQFLKLNDWTRASQMDSAEDHKQFLRGQYVPQCKLDCLSPGDIVLLRRYGYWLEALAAGDINPITDAQTAFVRVHRRACAPQTVFEILWFNYQIERIYELAQRTERTLGASEGFQYWQVHEIYRKAAILAIVERKHGSKGRETRVLHRAK